MSLRDNNQKLRLRKFGMRSRGEGAQGMVEFALTLPLLLFLVFGIMEFGRLLFIYSATFTASREAARYGSAGGDSSNGFPHYKDCGGIMDAAVNVGSMAGIQSASIQIQYDDGAGNLLQANCDPNMNLPGEGNRIKVTVYGNYSPVIPLFSINPYQIESTSRRTIIKDVAVAGLYLDTPTPAPPTVVPVPTATMDTPTEIPPTDSPDPTATMDIPTEIPPTDSPDPTATPTPSTMHLASFSGTRSGGSNNRHDTIVVGIHDTNHSPLDGVTVTIHMTTDNKTDSCLTSGGSCTVYFKDLKGNNSRTYRVQSVTCSGYIYDPSSNDVPDQISVP